MRLEYLRDMNVIKDMLEQLENGCKIVGITGNKDSWLAKLRQSEEVNRL